MERQWGKDGKIFIGKRVTVCNDKDQGCERCALFARCLGLSDILHEGILHGSKQGQARWVVCARVAGTSEYLALVWALVYRLSVSARRGWGGRGKDRKDRPGTPGVSTGQLGPAQREKQPKVPLPKKGTFPGICDQRMRIS